MFDVIVIGGGPTGSCTAHKLASLGYRVAVLEQRQKIGEKLCCTGIISLECVFAFSIPDEVILRKAKSARLFAPSGDELQISRETTQACIIDRPAFDRFLAEKARSAGAEYHQGHKVENLIFQNDRVLVESVSDRCNASLEARAVVVAAGFNTSLVKKLGLGHIGNYAAGIQAEVETPVDEVEVYFGQSIAPGFFAWLVPDAPGRGRAGLLTRRSPVLYQKQLLKSLASQGKIASADVALHHGGIPLNPLKKTYGSRVLVVGDAAGQVKPTTGGGIYFGMLCAEIAADTLHSAIQSGDLSAKNLSAYEHLWREKLGHELAIESFARMFYERLRDRHIDCIFEIVKAHGITETMSREANLSFDWHGEAMLRIIKDRTVSKITGLVRLPNKLKER